MQVVHSGAGGLRKHAQRIINKLVDKAGKQEAKHGYCQQAADGGQAAAAKRFKLEIHVAMF